MRARRAVFLDRDGVLNANVFYRDTSAWEAPRRVEDFRLLSGVVPALRLLQDSGFVLVLVSNQPNVALGKSTYAELRAIHEAMAISFERNGIRFLDYCYCPHHPRAVVPELGELCRCRKPSPYWIFRMASRYAIDLRMSWMVGDRATDTVCGAAAGVRSIRIGSVTEKDRNALWRAGSLPEAVNFLLRAGDGMQVASACMDKFEKAAHGGQFSVV